MKCGVCKETGKSLQHIKECSGIQVREVRDPEDLVGLTVTLNTETGEMHPAIPDSPESFLGLGQKSPPTPRQLNYAHNLLREREPYGLVADAEQTSGAEAAHEYVNGMDFDTIRGFIDSMIGQPRRSASQRTKQVHVDEGVYKYNGDIYKVIRAVHGSGHLYAKRLIPPSATELEFHEVNGTKPRPEWEMASGAITALRPEHAIPKEDARAFGALYGRCIRCGRVLTKEDSIERMMGDICAGKMGF